MLKEDFATFPLLVGSTLAAIDVANRFILIIAIIRW